MNNFEEHPVNNIDVHIYKIKIKIKIIKNIGIGIILKYQTVK